MSNLPPFTGIVVACTLLSLLRVAAETTTTTPDPELVEAQTRALIAQQELLLMQYRNQIARQDLQHQSDVATLEATIAEKAKAEREAIFGATLAPRDGAISVSSNSEAMIVAQARLGLIAEVISEKVGTNKNIYLMTGFPASDVKTAKSIRGLAISNINRILEGSGASNTEASDPNAAPKEKAVEPAPAPVPTVVDPEDPSKEAPKPSVEEAILEVKNLVLRGNTSRKDPGLIKAVAELERVRKLSEVAEDWNTTPGVGNLSPKSAKSAGIAVAVGAAQSVLSLLALARVDRTYTGVPLTPEQNAFLVTAMAALKKRDVTVHFGLSGDESEEALKNGLLGSYARLEGELSKANFELEETSKRIKEVEGMITAHAKAKTAAEAVLKDPQSTDEEKENAKKKIEKANAETPRMTDYLKTIASKKEPVDRLVKSGSESMASLEKGKVLGMDVVKLVEAEAYERSLKKGKILFLNVNGVAGTHLATKALLVNSFQAGAAASVSYVLIGENFAILQADTLYGYKGFYKVRDEKSEYIPSHADLDAKDPPKPTPSPKKKSRGGPRSK